LTDFPGGVLTRTAWNLPVLLDGGRQRWPYRRTGVTRPAWEAAFPLDDI